jgi:nitroimidazol reductase NimA-like FMN-containing flavoprotein (pyridoxamine 5'-phosphate oxidase superfamily)
MEEVEEVWTIIRELLESQRLAVLSTQGKEQPYSNLVAFAVTPDLRYLIFATTRATRKYANLKTEPRVSILIDNRSNQEIDFSEASAVTVLGTTTEAPDSDRGKYLRHYLHKHPYLKEFVTAPSCALMRVKVEKFIVVTQFKEVREIYPSS